MSDAAHPETLRARGAAGWLALDAAWWATIAVLVAYAIGAVLALPDMGVSWDEDFHRNYGMWVWGWYGAPTANPTGLPDPDGVMPYYGAFFDVLCVALEKLFPSIFHVHLRHAATAAFGLLGLFYAARIARDIAGPAAAPIAALLLALTPRWTGDSFFNPVDVPFGALHAAALFHLLRAARALPEASWGEWLKLGVATGLALGVRIGGVLLFAYAGAAVVLWAAMSWPPKRDVLVRIALRFAAMVAVAYLAAGLFWPHLLLDPIGHTLASLQASSKFPWKGAVYFGGTFFPGSAVPRSYLPTWFLLTTPPAIFAGLVLAGIFARDLVTTPERRREAAILALALLFPPVYAVARRVTLYDGLRHFLFLMPILAVLAASGWAKLLANAGKGANARIAIAVLGALSLEPALWLVRSHPYQYVYFNVLAGGFTDASRRYDTDYWGLSLREAAEWLDAHRAELVPGDGEMVVVTNAGWHLFTPWLRDPSRTRKTYRTDEPYHVFVEFYRGRPPGWHAVGRPLFVYAPVEGQVPFFRIHAGPAARRGP